MRIFTVALEQRRTESCGQQHCENSSRQEGRILEFERGGRSLSSLHLPFPPSFPLWGSHLHALG